MVARYWISFIFQVEAEENKVAAVRHEAELAKVKLWGLNPPESVWMVCKGASIS